MLEKQFIIIIITIYIVINSSVIVKTTSVSCYYKGAYECLNGIRIRFPFWSWGYDCGYPGLDIRCHDDYESGNAVMNISDHLYYVQNIDYRPGELSTIRVVDKDLDRQECPRPTRNFSSPESKGPWFNWVFPSRWNLFYNCSNSNNSSYPDDKYRIPCLDYNSTTTTTTVQLRSYAFNDNDDYYYAGTDHSFQLQNWLYKNCEQTVVTGGVITIGTQTYAQSARYGFELYLNVSSDCNNCMRSGGRCYYDNTTQLGNGCQCLETRFGRYVHNELNYCAASNGAHAAGMSTGFKAIIGVSTGVGGLLLILLLIYNRYSIISHWKNKFIKKPTNIQNFLENYGVTLQRYSYSEIKKMTNSFKDKLGQGGYGSVFQGKLNRDGLLVAVKVLNESKGNGEDFINEVATIGRTNHVNVVSLLGYCTERSKRALVYEFMPNGSLERFIYKDKMSTTPLGWEKLYQISLGIARGLEYLHCRCNTRIVHFDIKPHNILLDQGFSPKISDFGLAKLCPTKESIVSMVGARGTMGYIAPEVTCRNLGGVSHKSDVYSYGMMVLEMIGGRKNLDVTVENMSGIYYPHWIYNQLKQESSEVQQGAEVIKFEGAAEILQDATAKKMIIVALWCIQTHPANRPSMTKVVEMLEGSNEELHMPPNPSLDPVSQSSSSS